ncbi:chalcone isomerase family protein [Hahella ganghwensis]|uniref:chalcone isomerase family protein n=1 Tax=Hahella ganghwensis TaxID=286420 RepID=UPI0003718F1F|nr:chalcone isomerase family protein [Hahella ganghwensis]
MKHSIAALMAICLIYWSQPSPAAVVDGMEIPEQLPADGARPTLYLNGAAKRKFLLFVDVYVGSLYVETVSDNPSQLLNDNGYRRMEFQMLRNVRGRKIADAFYDGMQLNVTPNEALSMEPAIEQMVEMFDQRLSKGDIAVVEYIPGKGTHVVLAGNDRGTIPSKELFDAILSIWIGEFPVSQDFKSGILGIETASLEQPSHHRRDEDEF